MIKDIISDNGCELFRAIAEQTGQGISIADISTGRYIYVNRSFCEMTGYSEERLLEMKVRDIVPSDTELLLFPKLTKRESGIRETYLQKRDGTLFLAEIKGFPIDFEGQQYNMGIVSDITHTRNNEIIIEKFFDQPLNIHLIADLQGRIVRVNTGWEHHLGYAKDEVTGRTFFEFIHPEDVAATQEEMKKLEQGKTVFYFENRYRHRKGMYKFFAWSAVAVPEEKLVFAVASDITKQHSSEDILKLKIRELEKALEEVRTLRGIVPICSYCKQIRDDEGYWRRVEDYLSEQTDARFSHGLCPDCMKKYFPDLK